MWAYTSLYFYYVAELGRKLFMYKSTTNILTPTSLLHFFARSLLQYSPELHAWTPAKFPLLGASKQVLQMICSGTGCWQVDVAGYIATVFRRPLARESS